MSEHGRENTRENQNEGRNYRFRFHPPNYSGQIRVRTALVRLRPRFPVDVDPYVPRPSSNVQLQNYYSPRITLTHQNERPLSSMSLFEPWPPMSEINPRGIVNQNDLNHNFRFHPPNYCNQIRVRTALVRVRPRYPALVDPFLPRQSAYSNTEQMQLRHFHSPRPRSPSQRPEKPWPNMSYPRLRTPTSLPTPTWPAPRPNMQYLRCTASLRVPCPVNELDSILTRESPNSNSQRSINQPKSSTSVPRQRAAEDYWAKINKQLLSEVAGTSTQLPQTSTSKQVVSTKRYVQRKKNLKKIKRTPALQLDTSTSSEETLTPRKAHKRSNTKKKNAQKRIKSTSCTSSDSPIWEDNQSYKSMYSDSEISS